MKITKTKIQGVHVIELEPRVDGRGYFTRVFAKEELKKAGIDYEIVHINRSLSDKKGTIRGFHYQSHPKSEDKIVQCLTGSIFDVALDMRKDSPSYGKWYGEKLTSKNMKLLIIPKGVAHAFQTLEDNTVVEYFVSEYYSSENEKGVRWDDPKVNVKWPIKKATVSEKDAQWQYLPSMKVLVIGRNGQVGAALLNQAEELGIEAIGVDKKELNILDKEKIIRTLDKYKPTVVINTSAFHVVADCELHPEEAFLVNSAAVKHLADACFERKIKLVHYSTDKVFDGDKKSPYTEEDKPNPLQIYGVSKLAGEECASYYNPDTIVIRTCGIFGGLSGSRSKKGNFVLYILREAQKNKRLSISSEQIVSVAYAKDLARATLELLLRNAEKGIYNIVNSGQCSWADFAKEIVRLSGTKLKIEGIDRNGFMGGMKVPKYTALSTKKINSLGIELPTWKDSLKRYMQYLGKTSQ